MRPLVSLVLLVLLAAPAFSQPADPPKREFRGVWIATVGGLDWPDASTPELQQAELVRYFDRLRDSGVNAIIFQIRSEGDALYASDLEPWSHVLTGTQGQDPGWDPLAFAIEEAHKRGMELHAWFNPFRARSSATVQASSHVVNTRPEWILNFSGSNPLIDPGIPEARAYNASVVADVVRRYDVDGVHFDDYFYPYPNSGRGFPGITNEDDASYAADPRGLTRGNWRRDNINRFIQQVADSIAAVKPHVKYGISPFGIWQSGVPRGIVGMNAFSEIYADALAWLRAENLDYLTPQLYWNFGGGQDYAALAPWWQGQMRGDRHLYPGLGAYRDYAQTGVPAQIRFNQERGIQGSVLFRSDNITISGRAVVDGQIVRDHNPLRDSLQQVLWANLALPPTMPWKDAVAPNAPSDLRHAVTPENIRVMWSAPGAATDEDEASWYAVYRFERAPDLPADLEHSRHLIAVVPGDSLGYTDRSAEAFVTYRYAVTALDRVWNESAPAAPIVATSVDSGFGSVGSGLRVLPGQPNPFRGATQVRFSLAQPERVTARVYSALGQEVACLAEGRTFTTGTHTLTWSPDRLASGAYFVVVETASARESVVVTRAQ
jgi:uncharacterized lipoprotein YddW (UPF0748 family)